jgi:hypothetical protein
MNISMRRSAALAGVLCAAAAAENSAPGRKPAAAAASVRVSSGTRANAGGDAAAVTRAFVAPARRPPDFATLDRSADAAVQDGTELKDAPRDATTDEKRLALERRQAEEYKAYKDSLNEASIFGRRRLLKAFAAAQLRELEEFDARTRPPQRLRR